MIPTYSNRGLNLSRGSHKLLIDGPYMREIHRLIPSVQHRNHFTNPLEICFEHLFQIVTATAALFNQDSVLVVGEETHEEVTGANQIFLKCSQSAPHLHAIVWANMVVSMRTVEYVCKEFGGLEPEQS